MQSVFSSTRVFWNRVPPYEWWTHLDEGEREMPYSQTSVSVITLLLLSSVLRWLTCSVHFFFWNGQTQRPGKGWRWTPPPMQLLAPCLGLNIPRNLAPRFSSICENIEAPGIFPSPEKEIRDNCANLFRGCTKIMLKSNINENGTFFSSIFKLCTYIMDFMEVQDF